MEHLALDDHVATRQVLSKPLQMQPRKHQVRRRRADVDTDGGQLDVVGVVEIVLANRPVPPAGAVRVVVVVVVVIELEVVPEWRPDGPPRWMKHSLWTGLAARSRHGEELLHADLDAVLGSFVDEGAMDHRVLVFVLDLIAAQLHAARRDDVALGGFLFLVA